jgi:hypothetical protein
LYEIIDDFLPTEQYELIKEHFVYNEEFPWFWKDSQLSKVCDTFYFFHVLYVGDRPNSPYFDMFYPVFDKLKVNALINVRANLTTNTYGNGFNGKHKDNYSEHLTHKTAVYYFGTNNGKTVLCLEDGEIEIDTIDNRMIIFDANIDHYAKHQTDQNRRVVLNINYF